MLLKNNLNNFNKLIKVPLHKMSLFKLPKIPSQKSSLSKLKKMRMKVQSNNLIKMILIKMKQRIRLKRWLCQWNLILNKIHHKKSIPHNLKYKNLKPSLKIK
jgi:hypothetical protein